jgi:hypothetical protein
MVAVEDEVSINHASHFEFSASTRNSGPSPTEIGQLVEVDNELILLQGVKLLLRQIHSNTSSTETNIARDYLETVGTAMRPTTNDHISDIAEFTRVLNSSAREMDPEFPFEVAEEWLISNAAVAAMSVNENSQRVLFGIQLEDTIRTSDLRVEHFTEWFKGIPVVAKEIRIEGVFNSL